MEEAMGPVPTGTLTTFTGASPSSKGASSHYRKVDTNESAEPHKVRWRSLIMSNQNLLRSTPDYVILHSFGRVFRDFPDGFDTFKLSDTTHKLHVFISHNWATPRFIKFMALVFHFNHGSASIAATVAYICTVLVVILTAKTIDVDERLNDLYFLCHLGTGVCIATYWLCLLFWHDVKWLFCCRGKRVFLDRCCIHQTDEDLKQQGIEHLDVFLQLSDKMLVVYSELYTKKLWTMYELATFLPKRGPRRLVVLPTFLIRCTIFAVPMLILHCVWVQLLLVDSVHEQSSRLLPDSRLVIGVLDLPLLIAVTWAFRTWAKEEQQMLKNIRTFHYGDANCLKESDRSMVYANIARYMRDTKAVTAAATDEDALLAFNELVKTEVPMAVTKSLGGWGIPVRYLCVILLPLMTNILDYVVAAPYLHPEPLAMAMYTTGLITFALCSLVCATFLLWLTKRYLEVTGARQWLLIIAFSILHVFPFALIYFLVESLKLEFSKDQTQIWPFLCLLTLALGELLLLALFHCPCRDRNEELLRSNKRALYSYRVRFAKQFTMSSARGSPKSSPQHARQKSQNVNRSEAPEVLPERSQRLVHINSIASIFTSSNSKATSIVETRM